MRNAAAEFLLLKPQAHQAISKRRVVRLHSTGFDRPKEPEILAQTAPRSGMRPLAGTRNLTVGLGAALATSSWSGHTKNDGNEGTG
jgi:hypothetical protein